MSETSFLDLQNGFYNAVSQGLGFAPGSPFVLVQPSPPLVSATNQDNTLWEYFNNIPPFSLTYIASGGNQFFSNYKGLLSALVPPKDTFAQDVGPDVNTAWRIYVRSITPRPTINQLPQLFFNWAFLEFPEVANIGASDLAQILLNPIASAQLAIASFYTSVPQLPPAPPLPAARPDWSHNYADLQLQLASAPSRKFKLNSRSMDSDVSTSWTHGAHFGFFGLWGGSSSTSTESRKFAESKVEADVTFDHVTTFQATPGPWYSSAAMGNAYANRDKPPWDPSSTINWDNTFNGNMARFAVNLIVVSGMNVKVTSSAKFESEEQTTIQQNAGFFGLWPFYASSGGDGVSTNPKFELDGTMTVEIASAPNVPIVIGASVLPVDQFVGHAVAGARELAMAAD